MLQGVSIIGAPPLSEAALAQLCRFSRFAGCADKSLVCPTHRVSNSQRSSLGFYPRPQRYHQTTPGHHLLHCKERYELYAVAHLPHGRLSLFSGYLLLTTTDRHYFRDCHTSQKYRGVNRQPGLSFHLRRPLPCSTRPSCHIRPILFVLTSPARFFYRSI